MATERVTKHLERRANLKRRAGVGTGVVALVAFLAVFPTVTLVQADTSGAAPTRPNIVFILTDDLSWNLITPQITPHIVQLEHLARRSPTTTWPIRCVALRAPPSSPGCSRTTRKVATNTAPSGGYTKFLSEGLSKRTFAVALQKAEYKTSLLGKYLNAYGDRGDGFLLPKAQKDRMTKANAPVPPGWSDWHVSNGTGYAEFNYYLNDNGAYHFYPYAFGNYGVDVLNHDAQKFIKKNVHSPFLVEVATFAPHLPYTPAPRNAKDFPGLTEPRDPSFGTRIPIHRPGSVSDLWVPSSSPTSTPSTASGPRPSSRSTSCWLTPKPRLAAEHLTDSTYIVFSSDNGYHLGQHRVVRGKQTAFDTDIRVPLIVAGPGVPKGRAVRQVPQTWTSPDVRAARWTPTAHDGEGPAWFRSCIPPAESKWPTVALLSITAVTTTLPTRTSSPAGATRPRMTRSASQAQHLKGFTGPVEAPCTSSTSIPSTRSSTTTMRPTLFNLTTSPGTLTKKQRATLHGILEGLHNCHTATACWHAALPQ